MEINEQGPKSQDEYEIARLRTQVVGQQARIAELRKVLDGYAKQLATCQEDAKRYRWLRNRLYARMSPAYEKWRIVSTCQQFGDSREVTDWEKRIDEAMKGEQK